MADQVSISQWIAQLKFGEAEAAQNLWVHFSGRLVGLAKRKLRDLPTRVIDEEDIAQSVFRSVCRGAEAGRFDDVRTRDDLWWLLLGITKQKVVNHIRRETALKRGSGKVQSETCFTHFPDSSSAFTLDNLVGDEPTPEFLIILEEQNGRLLGLLRDEMLRRIAISRIEGYTVAEIATDLSISVRSVERKLNLIRSTWAEELSSVSKVRK